MKERPILFSAPMVCALLAGTKTQTRRVVKPQPTGAMPEGWSFQNLGVEGWYPVNGASRGVGIGRCPYGQPGDRLWVREAWRSGKLTDRFPPREMTPHPVWYEADGPAPDACNGKLRPGMFMPRWASRITLEVTGVRIERLQDISERDACAEGILELVPPANRGEGLTPGALAIAAAATVRGMPKLTRRGFLASALAASLGFRAGAQPWLVAEGRMERAPTAQQAYAILWNSINGPGAWERNPWIWAVEFRRV